MNSRQKHDFRESESDRNTSRKQLSTFEAETSEQTVPNILSSKEAQQSTTKSFEISVSLTNVQINGPIVRGHEVSSNGAKEDNKHSEFSGDQAAESESQSQEGCEQQNQTSGFAGNNDYRQDVQADEYGSEEADDRDPEDLKVYPKKADDQPENLTF